MLFGKMTTGDMRSSQESQHWDTVIVMFEDSMLEIRAFFCIYLSIYKYLSIYLSIYLAAWTRFCLPCWPLTDLPSGSAVSSMVLLKPLVLELAYSFRLYTLEPDPSLLSQRKQNVRQSNKWIGHIVIFLICIYVYVCEYPYAYISFIQWEVKQMNAFGDWTPFFWVWRNGRLV